jgi:hypothetical protein
VDGTWAQAGLNEGLQRWAAIAVVRAAAPTTALKADVADLCALVLLHITAVLHDGVRLCGLLWASQAKSPGLGPSSKMRWRREGGGRGSVASL